MNFDWDFSFVALTDYNGDNFLEVQSTPLGSDDVGSAVAGEARHPWGSMGRPHDPEVDAGGVPKRGAWLLQAGEHNGTHYFIYDDPRVTPALPPLPKGGWVAYGSTSATDPAAALTILSIDSSTNGSVTLLVPHKDASPAASSAISVDVSVPGKEQIALRHGAGMGISIFSGPKNPTTINNKAGDAQVIVDDDGVLMSGTKLVLNGAVLIGDPVAGEPLVLGPELLAWLTVLVAKLAAAPVGGGPIIVDPPPVAMLSTKAFAK